MASTTTPASTGTGSIESRTVVVTNLSSTTDEASLRKFFSFCGGIQTISTEAGGKATVVFEKESAAKTASFLSHGTLDGSTIHVATSESESTTVEDATTAGHDISQEEKPRAAVAAEYLAHGYVLSDQAIQKAIDLDNKHGLSKRFLAWFTPLQEKVVAKAQEIDQNRGITEKANQVATGADARLGASAKASQAIEMSKSYYSSALQSTWGAKVSQFYTDSAKQVQDVHEEAKRIAAARKPAPAPSEATTTTETAPAPPKA